MYSVERFVNVILIGIIFQLGKRIRYSLRIEILAIL